MTGHSEFDKATLDAFAARRLITMHEEVLMIADKLRDQGRPELALNLYDSVALLGSVSREIMKSVMSSLDGITRKEPTPLQEVGSPATPPPPRSLSAEESNANS